MEFKIRVFSKFFLGIVFFAICLFGAVIPVHAVFGKKYQLSTTTQFKPEGASLYLTSIENDTEGCQFKVFYGSNPSQGIIFEKSTLLLDEKNHLLLNSEPMLIIKCSKGSFYPVFIQHSGLASGQVPEGFEGPYTLVMWLAHPQVPETSKVYVRYVIKKGADGHVGIKIGKNGDYRFVAHQNVQFLL